MREMPNPNMGGTTLRVVLLFTAIIEPHGSWYELFIPSLAARINEILAKANPKPKGKQRKKQKNKQKGSKSSRRKPPASPPWILSLASEILSDIFVEAVETSSYTTQETANGVEILRTTVCIQATCQRFNNIILSRGVFWKALYSTEKLEFLTRRVKLSGAALLDVSIEYAGGERSRELLEPKARLIYKEADRIDKLILKMGPVAMDRYEYDPPFTTSLRTFPKTDCLALQGFGSLRLGAEGCTFPQLTTLSVRDELFRGVAPI